METHQKIQVLIPEVRLQTRISELAHEMNQDFQGKEITAVCILKGSFIFFSDMIRMLEAPVTCEFLGVSHYGRQTLASGEVKVTLDINEPLEGKHVVIFDDLVDSGLTLAYILNSLQARKPATLKTCSLLVRTEHLLPNIQVDYAGFKIGKEFVLGYGIDDSGRFRELPYIGYIEHGH